MKAVVIDQLGAPATVRDVPRPEPQPGDVLIKVQAAGVNPADEKVRMGANRDLPKLGLPASSAVIADRPDSYCASIQVFDPASFTATFEKKRCSGWSLRFPR